MEVSQQSSLARANLLIILVGAVVQGWALFGLYHATKYQHWPATNSSWLIALYTLAILLPTTVQLLAEHNRKEAHWLYVLLISVALFYFGWHQGTSVIDTSSSRYQNGDTFFPFSFIVTVFWLILLPFVQTRLTTGQWAVNYPLLFSSAWRNQLMLAEAMLFTGLFWLLLFLWQSLFAMLGIHFFRELFSEPIFIYPVTSIVFGVALYLIGSIERWTALVLEQILNVLKWLTTVAGVILTLFTVALIFKLPSMIATNQKAIDAAWLLWLVAVVVLFLNAAYRDGTNSRPYPAWLARPLQWIVPLTIVIALTACYALCIRTQRYGLTVERVWAFIVAGTALIYAIGYSLSAFSRNEWLPSIARVNVIAAIVLIFVIGTALTPALSPYRLAANSQFRMAQQTADAIDSRNQRNSPFHYLRFDAGLYGRKKLQELTELQNHPRAEQIHALAKAALAENDSWSQQSHTTADVAAVVAKLDVYPVGRSLETGLHDVLIADLSKTGIVYPFQHLETQEAVGVFVDLNGDATDEFVLQAANNGLVYQQQSGQWQRVAWTRPQEHSASYENLANALKAGNLSTKTPSWRELLIGEHVYMVSDHL